MSEILRWTEPMFSGAVSVERMSDPEGKLAKLVGVPVSAGGRVSLTTPDRKPNLDADGKRIIFQRPVTIARWTVVVDREGKIASVRKIVNPVTDSEEVRKIVEAPPKSGLGSR